jgi:REP element-mobilizing transposase RayT
MDRRRPDLRDHHIYRKVHRVLRHFLGREGFRVVHVSIQNQHLHLLVEAAHRMALARNMQGLEIRLQRAINGQLGRLFTHRYHAVQITTARQARNALAYVLNNWRRHRLDWNGGRLSTAQLDEFSSAISFTGWRRRFSMPVGHDPLPVSPPRTWLLRIGWRDYGLIDPFEVPGPLQ